MEQNKIVGPTSTILSVLTKRGGDLSKHFDIIDESESGINNSSLKQKLIFNHTEAN